MLSRLTKVGYVMISQHNLRFMTRVLVAAISIVGISSVYLCIAEMSEDVEKGAQPAAIDDMTTASISHFPEERLAVEAVVGGKAKHGSAQRIESSPADKTPSTKAVTLNTGKNTHPKILASPTKKTSKGIGDNISKAVIDKKTPEKRSQKSPVKKDPIASLLAKH
jgi:hypothetical protein